MLQRSFFFAKGMSEELERALWGAGVVHWDVLRKHPGAAVDVLGEGRTQRLVAAVNEAAEALARRDHHWFRVHWPERETWRLWRGWCEPHEVALLDIETTGRTPGYDQITVIGLSDGTRERAFVADRPLGDDQPLARFLEAIRAYKLVVTFNGQSFDLPFIERHFRAQNFHVDLPHIDLLWPARALGLTGSLKDMERQIGIVRDDGIAELRGNEAIGLWGAWKRGDREAYDRLVSYCKADCTNLRRFADHVYERTWATVYEPYAKEIDLDAAAGEQLTLF